MRQTTLTIYTFDELSDKAKERAKQDHAAVHGYAFNQEALKSLQALAEHFDGRTVDYGVDFFEMPEMDEAEIKSRLDALGSYDPQTLKGHGDCVLTGYCEDESAIDGFRRAFHEGERDLGNLMQAALDQWLKSVQEDCAAQYEDKQFSEEADANGYEYLENGKAFYEKKR